MADMKMASSHLQTVTITHVKDPSDFEVRPVFDEKACAEGRLFKAVDDALNEEFRNESQSFSGHEWKKGDLLAVRTKNKQWMRAQYIWEERRDMGRMALCKLVDNGEKALIPLDWLRVLPVRFRGIAFRVQRCGVWGVKPKTLSISPVDLTFHSIVTDTWDPSAAVFLKDWIARSVEIKVEYMGPDVRLDTHLVRLYFLRADGNTYCFNDALVAEDYAIQHIAGEERHVLEQSDKMKAAEYELNFGLPRPRVRLQTVAEAKKRKELRKARSSLCAPSPPKLASATPVLVCKDLSGVPPPPPCSDPRDKVSAELVPMFRDLQFVPETVGGRNVSPFSYKSGIRTGSAGKARHESGEGSEYGRRTSQRVSSLHPSVLLGSEKKVSGRKPMTVEEALRMIDDVAKGVYMMQPGIKSSVHCDGQTPMMSETATPRDEKHGTPSFQQGSLDIGGDLAVQADKCGSSFKEPSGREKRLPPGMLKKVCEAKVPIERESAHEIGMKWWAGDFSDGYAGPERTHSTRSGLAMPECFARMSSACESVSRDEAGAHLRIADSPSTKPSSSGLKTLLQHIGESESSSVDRPDRSLAKSQVQAARGAPGVDPSSVGRRPGSGRGLELLFSTLTPDRPDRYDKSLVNSQLQAARSAPDPSSMGRRPGRGRGLELLLSTLSPDRPDRSEKSLAKSQTQAERSAPGADPSSLGRQPGSGRGQKLLQLLLSSRSCDRPDRPDRSLARSQVPAARSGQAATSAARVDPSSVGRRPGSGRGLELLFSTLTPDRCDKSLAKSQLQAARSAPDPSSVSGRPGRGRGLELLFSTLSPDRPDRSDKSFAKTQTQAARSAPGADPSSVGRQPGSGRGQKLLQLLLSSRSCDRPDRPDRSLARYQLAAARSGQAATSAARVDPSSVGRRPGRARGLELLFSSPSPAPAGRGRGRGVLALFTELDKSTGRPGTDPGSQAFPPGPTPSLAKPSAFGIGGYSPLDSGNVHKKAECVDSTSSPGASVASSVMGENGASVGSSHTLPQ